MNESTVSISFNTAFGDPWKEICTKESASEQEGETMKREGREMNKRTKKWNKHSCLF
jgi:hypothetical protein